MKERSVDRLWLDLAWLGIALHLYFAAEEEVDEELVNMLLDSIVHWNEEATRMQKGNGEKGARRLLSRCPERSFSILFSTPLYPRRGAEKVSIATLTLPKILHPADVGS